MLRFINLKVYLFSFALLFCILFACVLPNRGTGGCAGIPEAEADAEPRETPCAASEAAQVRYGTVQAKDFSMSYFRFGKGAKIMVILPGLSVKNAAAFALDVAAAYKGFADEYTVYVFDRRSELPPVYTVGDMALDTAAALEVLGLKDTYMFGASQGGMMTLIIAAEHPELVKKAVLGSAADRLDGEHYRLFERWIKLARSGDARGLYLSFAESVYPQSFCKKNREAFIAAAAAVTEEELERFSILAAAAKDFDASALLPKIKSPVLVLGAADDRVLGAEGSERIAAALKCEIYMYSGFGHAAYDTAPDYKARILRFFEKE